VLVKLLVVFGLGVVGLWEGIPAGFVMRLHPVVIGATAAAGSITATLLVLLLGERLRRRLAGARDPEAPARDRLIDRVWRRYGVIGLGLVAPCLTGAPIGVALGLWLRVPPPRLLFWTLAGVVLWTVALTGIGVFGDAGLRSLIR
jgi:Putative small multi-drug export protein